MLCHSSGCFISNSGAWERYPFALSERCYRLAHFECNDIIHDCTFRKFFHLPMHNVSYLYIHAYNSCSRRPRRYACLVSESWIHVSHLASSQPGLDYIIASTHAQPPSVPNTIQPPTSSPPSTMGYYATRRRSSIHFTAEATLGFRVGISSRRISHAERVEQLKLASSNRNDITSGKVKPSTHPCYHRVVVPERSLVADTSFHAFCVAIDATYARLSERLDRRHEHKAALKLYMRAHGESGDLGEMLKSLQNDVMRLEGVLLGMRRRIEEGEGEWKGKGDVFLVGGRWATFL